MTAAPNRFYREPETLHDPAPCVGCRKALHEAGSPPFYRFGVKRPAPGRVVEEFAAVNVCAPCAEGMTVAELLGLVGGAA